jgi:hypothetical protein
MHQERGMEEGDKGEKCAEREINGDVTGVVHGCHSECVVSKISFSLLV